MAAAGACMVVTVPRPRPQAVPSRLARGAATPTCTSAIDGFSRLSCIEPLSDERGAIVAAFLARSKGLVRRPRHQQVDFGQLPVVEDIGVNLGPCAYRLLKAPARSTCTLRWPAMRLPWQRGRSRTVYSID